jgi:hypothetical protein
MARRHALVRMIVVLTPMLAPACAGSFSADRPTQGRTDKASQGQVSSSNLAPPDSPGVAPKPMVPLPRCHPADLTARVNHLHSGLLAGRANVVLVIRSRRAAPCLLGGLPSLAARTWHGPWRRLPFKRTADVALIGQPKPGVIDRPHPGMLRLQLDPGPAESKIGNNTCREDGRVGQRLHYSWSRVRYTRLRVRWELGAVSLKYPKIMYDGCPMRSSQLGRDYYRD